MEYSLLFLLVIFQVFLFGIQVDYKKFWKITIKNKKKTVFHRL